MKVESIVKTIPENDIRATCERLQIAGENEIMASGASHVMRCAAMQTILDTAKSAGVSLKQALIDVQQVIAVCALKKKEVMIPAERDARGVPIVVKTKGKPDRLKNPNTEWKLSYSMGRAYVKSFEIAWVQPNTLFSPSLYHNKSKADKEAKEAAHAEKVRAAELAAEKAAKAAKAAATKAAKAKTDEAKAEAAQAKAEAEKANEAVRAAIDAAPVSQKTGGRKKTKVEPAKVLTRHEVALHAARLVSMLRDLKEPCADEIADILSDNNLLVK